LVPTEIVFSSGATVKVTASVQEVADAIEAGGSTFDTARFAGFRGDEAVGGERVLVVVAAIAYAQEIKQP
jgi:hypothetical protein